MILVGELEYTHKMMAPDGNTGWLFVGQMEDLYVYAISPYSNKETANIGDRYVCAKNHSIEKFLQIVVNQDDELGRGVVKRYSDDVGIRLKGMNNWIKRK